MYHLYYLVCIVVNTIVFVASSTMKWSSILYAFMNILLGSMLGMYVMFNGYRILAVAGHVDKTKYKFSAGLSMFFMFLFVILGSGNINGFTRFATEAYGSSTAQGWWLTSILIESFGWLINLLLSSLTFLKGVLFIQISKKNAQACAERVYIKA